MFMVDRQDVYLHVDPSPEYRRALSSAQPLSVALDCLALSRTGLQWATQAQLIACHYLVSFIANRFSQVGFVMRSDLLKHMTRIALLAVLLGSCDVFAGPQIIDTTGKTVRVQYVNTGSRDLDTKAIKLIGNHCGERGFRVANRTVEVTHRNVSGEPTLITIDAVCL
jgi:hypothetical protein